jgi:hypothetical protein
MSQMKKILLTGVAALLVLTGAPAIGAEVPKQYRGLWCDGHNYSDVPPLPSYLESLTPEQRKAYEEKLSPEQLQELRQISKVSSLSRRYPGPDQHRPSPLITVVAKRPTAKAISTFAVMLSISVKRTPPQTTVRSMPLNQSPKVTDYM